MRKWLKNIFHIPKHSKPTDDNIMRMLLPSLAGIVICMVCLAASTWAWFSTAVQTKPQTITAANYGIEVVSITDADGGVVGAASSPLVYSLDVGTYTVTIKATGTAQSGGYCVIKDASGQVVFTTNEKLLPDSESSFTFAPTENGQYTFAAVWGSQSGAADISENNTQDNALALEPSGGSVEPLEDTGNEQPSDTASTAVYVVRVGDNLTKIAQEYGTTVAKLAAYNDIADPDYIQEGWELKIPPEDYEIPAVSSDTDITGQTEDTAQETPGTDDPEGQQASGTGDEQAADTSAESGSTDSADTEQTEPSQEE